MKQPSIPQPETATGTLLPWLHFLSCLAIFVSFSLYAAVHSALGRHVAPGESPGFGWVRDHMGLCLGLVLLSRVLLDAVQYRQVRRCPTGLGKGLRLLVWAELICIAATLRAVWVQDATGFPAVHTVYLIVVLAQGVGALGRRGVWQDFRRNGFLPNFSRPAAGAFVWLFLLGGL